MLTSMGVDYRMLGDYSDVVDAPATGDYDLYPAGGTTLADGARGDQRRWARSRCSAASSAKTGEFITQGVGPGVRGRSVPDRHHRAPTRSSPRSPRSPASRSAPSSSSSAAARSTRWSTRTRTCTASASRSWATRTCCSGSSASCSRSARGRCTSSRTNGDKKFKKAAEALLAELTVRRRRHRLDQEGHVAPALAHVHRAGRPAAGPEQRQVPVARHRARRSCASASRSSTVTTCTSGRSSAIDGAENLLTDIVNTVLDEMDRASDGHRVLRPGPLGEPAMSLSLDKLLEAGCQSDAKHKVCRSRGGESCAFDGAAIVLMPIADAAHVVHGPIVCAGNAWEGRGVHSTAGDFHRRGFTTDIDRARHRLRRREASSPSTVREVVAARAARKRCSCTRRA